MADKPLELNINMYDLAVKEYKKQDQEAVDWARTQLEQGHQIKYGCSW